MTYNGYDQSHPETTEFDFTNVHQDYSNGYNDADYYDVKDQYDYSDQMVDTRLNETTAGYGPLDMAEHWRGISRIGTGFFIAGFILFLAAGHPFLLAMVPVPFILGVIIKTVASKQVGKFITREKEDQAMRGWR